MAELSNVINIAHSNSRCFYGSAQLKAKPDQAKNR